MIPTCLRSVLARRLALTATVVLFAACTTTIRKHPEFHSRIGGITSVGVMPPEVQVTKVVFKGDNERLREEEVDIRTELPSLLVAYLGKRDFVVREVNLDEETFADLPELRFETSLVQDANVSAMNEMYEKLGMSPSKAESYARSLGPEVNQFADLASVDALAFSRYSGFKRSLGDLVAGAVLAAIAGGTAAAEGAILQVSLVDGATGDILWCNAIETTNAQQSFTDMIKGRSLLESMVRKLFDPFER